MAGGRHPSAEPSAPPPNGGQYLLQLLQKPPTASPPPQPLEPAHLPYHLLDPVVAAFGPSHPVQPWSSADPLHPQPPYLYPHSLFPPIYQPQNPWPLPAFASDAPAAAFDLRSSHLPFGSYPQFSPDPRVPPPRLPPFGEAAPLDKPSLPPISFGSFDRDPLPNGKSLDSGRPHFRPRHHGQQPPAAATPGRNFNGSPIWHHEQVPPPPWMKPNHGAGGAGAKRPCMMESRPGTNKPHAPQLNRQQRPKGQDRWGPANGRRDGERMVEKEGHLQLQRSIASPKLPLAMQLENPGPPARSNLHSASASDIEEWLADLHGEDGGEVDEELEMEQLVGSLKVEEEVDDKNAVGPKNGSRGKDRQADILRGLQVSSQRVRSSRRQIACRRDIEKFTSSFFLIYESLIPPEEEKAKQMQLFASLEKLVNKEWPTAQLYLYGSCNSSFGVSNSDVDVCMVLDADGINKPEILLKLAELLVSDNLENVQALTRARVPIVKLKDPVTKISGDICINHVLAVVNTKLLRDYAQIDVRLKQLAFVVKHWAKSRRVNETYQGTLSSYAYVLMCIHFLQCRQPAILPCLQKMKATYVVNVDDVECAYFDRVEELRDFGARNNESIAYLLWAFFDYWAYRHNYANDVISVRTGSLISKREKDWTRRIGNDRHLICIEDPFEINHDLGRVVDKHSIKTLRGEFERAADILQFDPNPCIILFEPYVPEPSHLET